MEPNEIEKIEEFNPGLTEFQKLEVASHFYAYNRSLPMFYEPKKEAFIAGAEWVKQQECEADEVKVRWVKASDRLPPFNERIVIKDCVGGIYVDEISRQDVYVTNYEWLEEPNK